MHRRHAISPGFADHYRDLGITSRKKHDSACKLILSVVVRDQSGQCAALTRVCIYVVCPGMLGEVLARLAKYKLESFSAFRIQLTRELIELVKTPTWQSSLVPPARHPRRGARCGAGGRLRERAPHE